MPRRRERPTVAYQGYVMYFSMESLKLHLEEVRIAELRELTSPSHTPTQQDIPCRRRIHRRHQ